MSNNVNAVIYGCSGLTLTDDEKRFFHDAKPLGFILFARNIDHPEQVTALVQSLKDLTGFDCPILIDQEGGRVARLKPPHWPKFLSMQSLIAGAENPEEIVYNNAKKIGQTLMSLGINVDCSPVCDLLLEDAHDIIGDRSFGSDPEQVARLGAKTCEGLRDVGVTPIIKHIPGHGRAYVDSHESLPVVDASLDILKNSDFKVFEHLKDQDCWAMTAHIIYQALDTELPATLSPIVIDYIRNEIGFNGVIISDDLSMKALQGDYGDRAQQSLKAGCDLVLHCNGKMDEMQSVFKGVSPISDRVRLKLHDFKMSLAGIEPVKITNL